MQRSSPAEEAEEGRAVPVLRPDERGQLVLDETALRSVLMREDVRHLPVVVVAVAGAFRRGKSFLLSLLLRFLEAGGAADWLEPRDRPLRGFAWRSGRQRHTLGAHLWSRPARVRLPSGEQVAVVLMDTQGTFDDRSVAHENATMFALSALVSSVQIFNVANGLGTADLQHLEQFTEFGRLAAESGRGRPFQKLLFLVRDWQAPCDAAYGHAGGKIVLREVLESPAGTPAELRRMRENVRQMFASIDCFLLPHPGKAVATSATFEGCPRDIDPEFLDCVDWLARLVLNPENLVVKQVDGERLTCEDLVTHFQAFHETFKSGELPEPKSLVDTMSEANHLAGVSRGHTLYAERMKELCSEESPAVPEEDLETHHQRVVAEVVAAFENQKKMKGASAVSYKQKLMSGIDQWRQQFFNANKMKNELAEAKDKLRCNDELRQARDAYRASMGLVLDASTEPVEQGELEQRHRRSRDDALRTFDARTASCRPEAAAAFRQQLEEDLQTAWEEMALFNAQRRTGEAETAERDRRALEQARQRYRSIMHDCTAGGPVADQEFGLRHARAEQEARAMFRANRGEGHSQAPRVDRMFDRSLGREHETFSVGNVLKNAISGLLPVLGSVVERAVSKCVVM